MEKEYLLSVTAKNHTGVLLRIAGLFSRRCYNILSIVAAQSEDSETSRLIIVVKGDDKIVRQVEKQLCKLYDVEQVDVLNEDEAVIREYLLIKVARNSETNAQLVAIATNWAFVSEFRATLMSRYSRMTASSSFNTSTCSTS